MKIVVYPSDSYGCGSFRAIWPGEALAAAGHDVEVIRAQDRRVRLVMEDDTVRDVLVEADVVVLQRITHRWMAEAVPVMRAKGITVVVDVDDDLSSIHPANPAWAVHHPGSGGPHSWRNLAAACRDASLVTVSTPALLDVYARHGRGHVLHNYLPDMYYGLPRTDSGTVGWPGSFHSHPNDPEVVGGAVARLVEDGGKFVMRGDSTGAGRAFGLGADPVGGGDRSVGGYEVQRGEVVAEAAGDVGGWGAVGGFSACGVSAAARDGRGGPRGPSAYVVPGVETAAGVAGVAAGVVGGGAYGGRAAQAARSLVALG